MSEIFRSISELPTDLVHVTTINNDDDDDDDHDNNNNNNNNNNTKIYNVRIFTLSMNRRRGQVTRWPDGVFLTVTRSLSKISRVTVF